MCEIKEELDEVVCKKRMIEMLVAFDKFCEENNLTYFLSWGTLIGALRHKGFIPWDDDIDLSMPRNDYNRLIELSETWDLPYDFLCWEKDDNYPKCFGKISDRETILENFYMEDISGMGLFIDIFPIDNVTVHEYEREEYQNKLMRIGKMLTLSSMKQFWPSESALKSGVKYALYLFAKCKGMRYWRDKQEATLKRAALVSGTPCEYCVCDYVVIPNKWFTETVKVEFEGYLFSAPKDADSFLRYYYGDYMTLPPVEKRVSVHDHKVYKR